MVFVHSSIVAMLMLVFTSLLLIQSAFAEPALCSTELIGSQMKYLYSSFRDITTNDANLLAGFIRGGFHDCATTTRNKRNSGCNGSLRDEGSARPNARLVSTIKTVTEEVDATAPCVSYADAFMLAYSAAVKTATDLSIVPLLVDPSNPRTDSIDGDTDADEQNRLPLPNGGSVNFTELLQFYTDRKMTVRDLISSNAIGHSVGSVRSRNVDALFPINNFTAVPDRGGPFYTAHLLWRSDTGAEQDLKGFFTLPSDRTLTSDPAGYRIFDSYAAYKILRSSGKIRFSWTRAESRRTLLDFQLFSVKMSQLSGDIMTGAKSFVIPRAASKLKRESAGWDGPRNRRFTGTRLSKDFHPAMSKITDEEKPWNKVGPAFFQTFNEMP